MPTRTPLLADRLPTIAWAALLLACSTGCAGANRSPDQASAEAMRATVDSTVNVFHEALRNNDSLGVLAYIADDAMMMPPGENPVRGKEEFRKWLAAFLGQYRTSSLLMKNQELFVGQGWATEVGEYEWGLTPVAGGAPIQDRGHYMQVWKQLPDGSWRFLRELWNSSAPPAP